MTMYGINEENKKINELNKKITSIEEVKRNIKLINESNDKLYE